MAFDAEGNVIDIKQAINAVRKITIEASRSADHEDRDFGAKPLCDGKRGSEKP